MTSFLPSTLEQAKIRDIPPTAYYIPDFISVNEERSILSKVQDQAFFCVIRPNHNAQLIESCRQIAAAPKPRCKQLTHRRLQTWPSDLVHDRLLDAPLPSWLVDPILPRLLSLPISQDCRDNLFAGSPHQRPNHVLINEYPPGVSIMPHNYADLLQDGAAYWPVVCTISLGSSLCLNLHRNRADGALGEEPSWRILQEPRSLLITLDDLYTDHLHGIASIFEDVNLSAGANVANWSLLGHPDAFVDCCNTRKMRTSLTYRDVLKVSRQAGIFRSTMK